MRTAQIGDDGRIYDADGNIYGAAKPRQVRQLGQYPQMKEYARRENARPVEWYPRTYSDSPLQPKTKTSYNPHENVSWYLKGLDAKKTQMLRNRVPNLSGPPDVPEACLVPPGGGTGYKIAQAVAKPLSSGYTFTRETGDPSKNVYPNRFVVSDSYPEILFRVAYRAASTASNVRLLTLQGQGAGNYIEVPIAPDGSKSPSLLGSFSVVPKNCEWSVENSYVNPLPIFGGGKSNDSAKISITYVTAALQQAWYMISTLVMDTTNPTEYQNCVTEAITSTLAAGALALTAVDMAAASYDFEVIGSKELNIFLRVGVSIYQKAAVLYDMVDPSKSDSLANVNDPGKAASFDAMVTDVSSWANYWASMTARATLYYTQTAIYRALAGYSMFDSMADRIGEIYGTYSSDPQSAIKKLIGQDEPGKGPITAERAAQILEEFKDWILNKYREVRKGSSDYLAIIQKNVFPNIDFDELPISYFMYDQLLKENAQTCIDARKAARGEGPACFDGLGVDPPGGEPAKPAMAGPNFYKQEKEILTAIIVSKAGEFKAKGMTFNIAAGKTADLLEAHILQGVVNDALKDSAIDSKDVQLASEVQRSQEVALARARNPVERRKALEENKVYSANFVKEHLTNFKSRFTSDLSILRSARKSQEIVDAAAKLADTLTEGLSAEVPDDKGGVKRSYRLGLMLPGEKDKEGVEPSQLVANPEARPGLSARMFVDFVQGIAKIGLFKLPGLKGEEGTVKRAEWEGAIIKMLATNFGMDEPDKIDKALQVEQAHIAASLRGAAGEGLAEKDASAKSPDKKNPDGVAYSGKEGEKYTLSNALVTKLEARRAAISMIRGSLGVEMKGGSRSGELTEYYEKLRREIESEGIVKVTKPVQDTIIAMISIADGLIKSATTWKDNYEDTKKNKDERDEFKLDPENVLNAQKLVRSLSAAKALRDVLNKVLEGGDVDIETVKKNMKDLADASGDLEHMMDLVLPEWDNMSLFTRIKKNAKAFFVWSHTVLNGTSWFPIAQKSALMRTMLALITYPVYLTVLFSPFFAVGAIFAGSGIWEYTPVAIVWGPLVSLLRLLRTFLPSRGSGDYDLPGEDNKGSGKMDPIWKFGILTLGISAIFFGDKLFPAIGAIFGTLSRGIDSLTKVIVPKKGARGRGRPPGEQKYAGRGAPIKVDEVAVKLKDARDQGNAKEEIRLVEKLKRAEDRGQKIPPGLIGWMFR